MLPQVKELQPPDFPKLAAGIPCSKKPQFAADVRQTGGNIYEFSGFEFFRKFDGSIVNRKNSSVFISSPNFGDSDAFLANIRDSERQKWGICGWLRGDFIFVNNSIAFRTQEG